MVTRRRFIGGALGAAAAAAAAAAGVPLELAGELADAGDAPNASPAASSPAGAGAECVLLDLGSRREIRESFAGYESALTSIAVSWSRSTGEVRHYRRLIVAPAATGLDSAAVTLLAILACTGSTVVVELASAFAEDASSFDSDREALREMMGVEIGQPVNLWPRRSSGMPYVNYLWPARVSVRDFSRVLPLTVPDGDAIAHVGDMPVAVRCRKDLGTILILGSPLGAALRSGDAEARRWLGRVVESSRGRMVDYEARQREIIAARAAR